MLFLFLANVRTTVISLVTLPLSLIASILALHYMGLAVFIWMSSSSLLEQIFLGE